MQIRRLLSTGVVVLGIALPIGSAHAATIAKAKKGNATLAAAQPISMQPVLVLKQKNPNDTLATAQPVSPTYEASEVTRSLSKGQPQAFFSFPAFAGGHVHLHVSAKKPTSEFTELLLYDNNTNLVAVASQNDADASSSVIDFAIPGGQSGTWTAEVTGSPNHPEPKASFFKYDLRVQDSGVVYTVDVHGTFGKKQNPGFYSVAARAGDNMHFASSVIKPDAGLSELLLYDNNGNLVAVAAGNASDARGCVIDFTVPDFEDGNWTVEVTASPSIDPSVKSFTYDLLIRGATGTGPVVPR